MSVADHNRQVWVLVESAILSERFPLFGLSRSPVDRPSSVQLVVTVQDKGVEVNQHRLSSRLDFENGLVEELVGAFFIAWKGDLNVFDGLAFKRIANL